jgi:hypothetical protein
MSLIMVFPCIDGIVLATDSRSATLDTAGKVNLISDDSIKLFPVGGNMGVLTHGICEIGFNGISTLSMAFPHQDKIPIDNTATQATSIFLQVDRTWNKNHPHFRRSQGDVGFLLAGFDAVNGSSRIFGFSSPEYLPRQISKPFAIEGKWPIAKKLARHLFKASLSTGAVCALANFFIRATADKDSSVGGSVQIAILSPTQGYTAIGEEQKKIAADNSEKLFHQYKNNYWRITEVIR